jgi:WD40 repeat protein/serine/threonine protein kinase
MNVDFEKLRAVFDAAVERHTPEQWSAYLDQACAGDEELRRQAALLLKAHAQGRGPLDREVFDGDRRTSYPAMTEGPGTRIGPYKLLELIGEGGMGTVWMAEQQEPVRRLVALKIIKAGMDSAQVVARFEAERQALALMDHPHIAKVFDGGTTAGGRPYFVMELVKGVPITRYADEHRLTPRQRLELFVPVCEAIQHAHQKGVIHRDVKPSNVLVAPYDGRPVVKVIDFGVAKATGQKLTERTLFTFLGAVVGTLEYMSPEQAELNNQDIDTRSDIYSLGVLLYELLTGTTPLSKARLKEAAFTEMLRVIREEEPPRPSTRLSESTEALPAISAQRQTEPAKLAKLLRGELDWIVMKALEKDRARRYETANGLARDLERYLADEPVEACPSSAGYRLKKFARRYRKALTVGAAFAVLLVLGVVVSTWQAVRATRAEGEATAAQEKTQAALDRERESLERERQNAYYQRIALADRELSVNNLSRADELLELCPPDMRGWEWHYLRRLRLKVLQTLRHDSAVFCAAFSPDGERVATASQDGRVTIWDAQSGQQLFQFRAHDNHARTVAYSPDGRLLATSSWDKTVKVWEVQTMVPERAPSPLRTLRHQGVRFSAIFSPDGKRLATAGNRPTRPDGLGRQLAEVKIFDVTSGQELCILEGDERTMWSALAFSPDGQFLATGHHQEHQDGIVGNVVHIWEANTGRKIRTLVGHDQPVQSVVFSPNGRLLASGAGKPADVVGADGELKIWDVPTGREVLDLRGHITVCALAFSPDGRRLASAGKDQTIKLWDTATGNEVITLRGHLDIVRTVAFSRNGRQLVSASHDMTVRVWDATPLNGQTDSASLTLRGHEGDVASLAFSSDGHYLVSAGQDRTVRLWDARTGEQLKALQGHKGVVLTVAFSPDGRWLASRGSRDPTVTIWDTTTWEVNRSFHQPSNSFNHSVAFSPDGKLLAAAGASPSDVNQQVVMIRDASTGREIHRMPGHTWNISGVAFDRTGEFLASAGADSTVRIWDVRAGKQVVTLQPGHEGSATSVDFSPDGRYLASGSLDRTVKIWSTRTWTLRRTLADAYGGIQSLAFAPDSQRVAWGGTDATVKIADVTTGLILETLRGHTGRVNKVAFSPDGQRIASASADGTVKIWRAPPVVEPRAGETRNQGP